MCWELSDTEGVWKSESIETDLNNVGFGLGNVV